jgi:hypothetical protein
MELPRKKDANQNLLRSTWDVSHLFFQVMSTWSFHTLQKNIYQTYLSRNLNDLEK